MATRNHIDRILNATMLGRNTVNAALDLLALEPDSMARIDDTLELAIQQLTEARARIIRALEDDLQKELAATCMDWQESKGLCLLKKGHGGTRHIDTAHNTSWPIQSESSHCQVCGLNVGDVWCEDCRPCSICEKPAGECYGHDQNSV